MRRFIQRLEFLVILLLFIGGTTYLLKMAYMPVLYVTAYGLVFILAVYIYLRARYDIRIPPVLLVLVLCAAEVDGVGNYFRMYGRQFGPVQYDEFAHMAVQALTAPLIVWLLREGIVRFGYRLPLGLIVFFSITVMFSISAFYEVVEMWDELYFKGLRIWSTHDAPNDLQWDFCGIIIGATLAYLFLKFSAANKPSTANET